MQLVRLVVTILIFGLLSACAESPTKLESDLGIKGAPDWVNEGSQAVSDKEGRLIHGMGSSQALGNESLQRSTADNRARAEIARVISSYMDVTMRDYMQTQANSHPGLSSAKEMQGNGVSSEIEQEIRSVTHVVINGSKVIGRWKDKRTGILYAFAELDLKTLDQAILSAEKLNKNFKEYYGSNNEMVFDQFTQEND